MIISKLINSDLLDLRIKFLAAGFDLRFVGGCVRDVLANLKPKDIDLCTDATPDEQIDIYKQHNIRYIETGLQHGTVSVVLDSVVYEITSLRIDAETDGRHAVVVYTRNWIEDLARRDFTMNAMSLTFDGELIDPFGGFNDLQNNLVKFVGDPMERIREDYLRILRWFRFRGRFGMTKNAADLSAVKLLAHGLEDISRERVWSEISRILAGNNGPQIMREIHDTQAARWINLPRVCWVNEATNIHNLTCDPVTILVALYGDHAPLILKAWKASSREINQADWLSKYQFDDCLFPMYHMAMSDISGEWAAQLAALRGGDSFVQEVLRAWVPPAFPVSGNDLMAMNVKPGPQMGEILKKLRHKWAFSKCNMERCELLTKTVDIIQNYAKN